MKWVAYLLGGNVFSQNYFSLQPEVQMEDIVIQVQVLLTVARISSDLTQWVTLYIIHISPVLYRWHKLYIFPLVHIHTCTEYFSSIHSIRKPCWAGEAGCEVIPEHSLSSCVTLSRVIPAHCTLLASSHSFLYPHNSHPCWVGLEKYFSKIFLKL